MLDQAAVLAAHKRGAVSRRQRDELLELVERGVTDPCVAGVSPGLCKVWYRVAPVDAQLGGAIADVRTAILGKGKAQVHYGIASSLSAHSSCTELNSFLSDWLSVTRDVAVLEALAWRWLSAAGAFSDELRDEPEPAVTVAQAQEHPKHLLDLLIAFRRQFKGLRFSPSTVVDGIALEHEWWTKDSPKRLDTLVRSCIDDELQENEWATRLQVMNRLHGMTEDEKRDSLERLVDSRELECFEAADGETAADAMTLCKIATASRDVKNLAKWFRQAAARHWPARRRCGAGRPLNPEQSALFQRVMDEGARLTICCAPAGTGKTYTAGAIIDAILGSDFVDDESDAESESESETLMRLHNRGEKRTVTSKAVVLCLAPTWKAVAVLRGKLSDDKGRVEFRTVQGFSCMHLAPFVKLVVVDEASMLTMPHIRSILESYRDRTATRILFLGDDAQLPCIGRGEPLQNLLSVVPPVRLTACMRTEGRALVAAAAAVRNDLDIEPVGGEVEIASVEDMQSIAAHAAMASPCAPWEAGYIQMVTAQNNHVKELNEIAQKARHGHLDGDTSSSCFVGDAVRIHKNSDEYKNGDEGVLVSLGPPRKRKRSDKPSRKGTVRLRSGRTVVVEDGDMAPAYAATIHKVQGSEYETVVVALPGGINPRMLTRQLVYTAVTRAQKRLVVAGMVELVEHVQPEVRRTVFELV